MKRIALLRKVLRPQALAALAALLTLSRLASAAPLVLTPPQEQAAETLKAKGASVMQIAADSDLLSVDLGIAGKAVGDAELALVKELPKVSELDVHGTSITDAGLAAVEGLTTLTRLHLEKTAVTDAGMAHLKGLTALEYLNLYDTAVTDAGLSELDGLKSLKKLYLWQTKVTDAGADAFKKAVPTVDLNRGEELAAAPVPVPTAPSPMPPTPPPAPAPAPAPAPVVKPAEPSTSAEYKPDDEGFIRNWLLLAPIPLAQGTSGTAGVDQEQAPGEKDLKPKEGDKFKAGDKELVWKAVKATDYDVDFIEILGAQTDNSAAYLVVYIQSDAERKGISLFMGSDDQGKVYLNGKEVIKSTAPRGLDKDQDKAENLSLDAGTNVLVFKVVNEGGGWQGCLRFKDSAGQPVKDLRLKLTP
jgi:hypothetical protein